MKNKITDLNDHLFAAMERLNDETLEGPALSAEVARAKAIAGVGERILEGHRLVLDAEKFVQGVKRGGGPAPRMPLLGHDGE